MAKKDQIIMLNLEQLENLHTQILFNPDDAKLTVLGFIQKARNKVDNTFSTEHIKQAISIRFDMPVEKFTTTTDGNKHSGARARRFLAVLLTYFTALDRKAIMEVCGYSHNSSISLAIQETANGIQTYKADAELYRELVEILQDLKNQDN